MTIDTFHHLGLITPDMPATVSAYERLGFMFTPISLPKFPLAPGGAPEPVGVANRCAIFENSFLEMLGVVDAARWASISPEQRGAFDIDRALRRYSGLHVMHFGTNDIEAEWSRLTLAGLGPTPIRPFQRMVETPDGPQLMRARSLTFDRDANPEALLQIAQHETPELVLQPRYMNHPNGARTISEAIVCAADPDAFAQKYSGYTDHPIRRRDQLRIVDLGRARVVVVPPEHVDEVPTGATAPAPPFLAGFTVSGDLDQARTWFEANGIPFTSHDGRLHIRPSEGCGSAVLFESVGASR